MKLNAKPDRIATHEGGTAKRINPELQLRRSVIACMLWEQTFYENGEDIASRIMNIIPNVDPIKTRDIVIEAREEMKLRHVPLLITRAMAQTDSHKILVSDLLQRIIQRPDEITEFLKIYWKDKKQPLSAQVKKGLARAFTKFDAYQLAKYNRKEEIKLRDALFLCHAKPQDKEQEGVWQKLINDTLEAPDTWEVALSGGVDKKEAFERLLREHKLGSMALLRNLRNMTEANVSKQLINEGLISLDVSKILPFRFISAAKAVPQLEPELEAAMMQAVNQQEKLSGSTIILVDVSGSMESSLSEKSILTRMDAACGLAILAREMCEDVQVFTFSATLVAVPPRHGFALRDAITQSQYHGQTLLKAAIASINENVQYDRIIVFTDEQSQDSIQAPNAKGYLINLSNYENGVGYGDWTHIDGFSEATLRYIVESENLKS